MAIIKDKTEEENKTENEIDNKLELIKSFTDVKSDLHKSITSDLVLARFTDKEKEFITEMVHNGYYGQQLIELASLKATTWNWNKKERQWEERRIDKKTREAMKQEGKRCFNAYMIRPHMLGILHRNIPKNYLIRLIMGLPESEEEEDIMKSEREKKEEKIERLKENAKRWNNKRNT